MWRSSSGNVTARGDIRCHNFSSVLWAVIKEHRGSMLSQTEEQLDK